MAKEIILAAPSTHGDNRHKMNSNFTELYDLIPTKSVKVGSLSDLPTPVGGVITLSTDGVTYLWDGLINIGANRLNITADAVKFGSWNPFACGIMSSNTGVLITCNKTFGIDSLLLLGAGTHGLLGSNLGTHTIILNNTAFQGFGTGVDATDFKNCIVDTCSFTNCVDGLSFAGTITHALIKSTLFEGVTGKLIDLDGCTSKAWTISDNIAELTATSTFLTLGAGGSNILAGGEGSITYNKIDNTAGGILTSGYSPFDEAWTVLGSTGIPNSDKLEPTGWGFYVDNASTNLNLSTTPVLFDVNALDPTSDEDYLPSALIDQNLSLWDTTTNTITPALLGDSYTLRVQTVVNNTSGNPIRMSLNLDIGGGASPTTVIASDSKTIKGGGFPQTYLFTMHFFSKSQFLIGKGRVFLSLDTGTVEIGARSILLTRSSSGVRSAN